MQSFLQHRRLTRAVAAKHESDDTTDARLTSEQAESTESATKSISSGSDQDGIDCNSQDTNGSVDATHVVDWDGSKDPQNPKNWSHLAKLNVVLIVWINVFVLDWASSADSQTNTSISKTFDVPKEIETLSPAMYVFGIAAGCLFAGPLSETVGRNPIYIFSRLFHLAWVLGSALAPNLAAQLVFRFLAGLGASNILAIHGASLADIYGPHERSLAWPFVALGSFLGTSLAPIVGGWIENNSIDWRWTEWIALMLSGFSFIVTLLFLPETFPPMLLQWKAGILRKITGDNEYRSAARSHDSLKSRLKRCFKRAFLMATHEYIVITLGAWLVLVYIVVFGNLNGFRYIFEDTYDFSDGAAGSVFGSITVGLLLSTALAPLWGHLYRKCTIKWLHEHPTEGTPPPEYRLWMAFPVALTFPISLFWLGWTNYTDISYWSDICALALFGFSWAGIYVAIYLYILDVYGIYAGSALAAITCFRYAFSGMMIATSRPMYEGIGVQWTLTILGTFAALLAPAPLAFYRFGNRIRAFSRFAGQPTREHGASTEAANTEHSKIEAEA